ncbi:hypothetical protein [Pseudoduganella buxea]|uniref:Uncharacterized protein n=1 Tax=Pseudoduganella buxea TaxID=1949069 RepID=A0A6I3T7N6_9BURK|nr:hypothetical protein [Pseudoduganella buxea]MTV56382.1 hypothetical protein [Pseudoduganella buxea]GGC25534.1 hypothetical protein GCM10011572_53650 [Pseudoduganella buxea]
MNQESVAIENMFAEGSMTARPVPQPEGGAGVATDATAAVTTATIAAAGAGLIAAGGTGLAGRVAAIASEEVTGAISATTAPAALMVLVGLAIDGASG